MPGIRVLAPIGEGWEYSLDNQTWQADTLFTALPNGSPFVAGEKYPVFSRNVTEELLVDDDIPFGDPTNDNEGESNGNLDELFRDTDLSVPQYEADGVAVTVTQQMGPNGFVERIVRRMDFSRLAEYIIATVNNDWLAILYTKLVSIITTPYAGLLIDKIQDFLTLDRAARRGFTPSQTALDPADQIVVLRKVLVNGQPVTGPDGEPIYGAVKVPPSAFGLGLSATTAIDASTTDQVQFLGGIVANLPQTTDTTLPELVLGPGNVVQVRGGVMPLLLSPVLSFGDHYESLPFVDPPLLSPVLSFGDHYESLPFVRTESSRSISGANTIAEGATQRYRLLVHFSDNTTEDRTPFAQELLENWRQGESISNDGDVSIPPNSLQGDGHDLTVVYVEGGVRTSRVIQVIDVSNPPPRVEVSREITGPGFINEGTTNRFRLFVNFSDGSQEEHTTQATESLEGWNPGEVINNDGDVTIPANSVTGDGHALTVVFVENGIRKARTVQVVDTSVAGVNRNPVLAIPTPSLSATVGTSFSKSWPAGTFTDPDGDALTYSLTAQDPISGDYGALPFNWTFNPATRTLSGSAPNNIGYHVGLCLAVSDGRGGLKEDYFPFTTTPTD